MRKQNLKMTGTYSVGNKQYRLEFFDTTNAELFNYYLVREGKEDLLISSVYKKYVNRIRGAERVGDILEEFYGDYRIHSDVEELLMQFKGRPWSEYDDVANRKLVDDRVDLFVDVVERKSLEFYHKTVHLNSLQVIEEVIQCLDEEGKILTEFSISMEEEGRRVRPRKIKGLEYQERLVTERSNANRFLNIQSLDYIGTQKDIGWIKERNYRIVDNEEDLREYIKKIEATDKIIGFDTETTGLRINRLPLTHPERDNLVGICISVEDYEGIYIPVRQKRFNNIEEKVVVEMLQPYFDRKGIKKKSLVTHNGKFDWKVMYAYGWDLNFTDDTLILQYLLDVNSDKGLSTMAENILKLDMVDLSDFFPSARGKKSQVSFDLLPYESVRHYGPVDPDITRELYYFLRPKLPKEQLFLYSIEMALMRRLARIEYYGIRIDVEGMLERKEKEQFKKDELESQIYELAGEEFNINSGDQLAVIMFDKLGYPSLELTKSGKRSTGKNVLKELSGEKVERDGEFVKGVEGDIVDKDGFKLLYPLAHLILEYKKTEKLLNSFLVKLLRENVDGFIFPGYNQAGTKSGRLSGSNPNLQQTSGKIRELFIPDSDEYYFLIVDYSQVEYRILAGLAGEQEVVDFFANNPEADFHILMYARMVAKLYNEVSSEERGEGKTLNFGINYGMSDPSLAKMLYGKVSPETIAKAGQKKVEYFDSVPNIRDYLTTVRDRAKVRGYVETYFRRRREIEEFTIYKDDKRRIGSGDRKAGNTVVQGTAADVMKYSHVKVENALEKGSYDARVVATVHDELVVMSHKKHNPWEMIALLRENMELDLSKAGFPPLYIGANVGYSWGDGKRDNLEAPVLLMDRKVEEFKEGRYREGLVDPRQEVYEEITRFAIEQVRKEIEGSNAEGIIVKNVKDALNIQRLATYARNYLGDNKESVIKGILLGKSDEEIYEAMTYVENFSEDYYEDEFLALEFEDEEEVEEFDEEGRDFQARLYHFKVGGEEVASPEIRYANEIYGKDFSIMGFDKELIIRMEKPTEGMIKDLVAYFKGNSVKKGYKVIFQVGGKRIDTGLQVSQIDRIGIIGVVEQYLEIDKEEEVS